jgi:Ni/Co efflux regulator RcnB
MNAKRSHLLAAALVLGIGSSSALAEKGGKHGHGHGNERDDDRYEERHEHRRGDKKHRDAHRDDHRSGGVSIDIRFGDSHRHAIHDYYSPQFRSGHCPPGLAKKGNGCQPPGQAKKWRRGHALPRDLTYYPIPRDLRMRLPSAPSGYDYVRVGADILMIAVGTRMVIDAIEDIGR